MAPSRPSTSAGFARRPGFAEIPKPFASTKQGPAKKEASPKRIASIAWSDGASIGDDEGSRKVGRGVSRKTSEATDNAKFLLIMSQKSNLETKTKSLEDEKRALADRTHDLTVQVEELTSQLQKKSAAMEALEIERQMLQSHMDEVTQEYNDQIKGLSKKLEESTVQLSKQSDKIGRIERLEAAIISMVLEFRERIHPDGRVGGLDYERADLRQLTPMALLDMLRASVLYLKDFKDDFEDEVIGRAAIKAQTDARVIDLTKRLDRMTQEKHKVEQSWADAIDDLEKARQDLANYATTSKARIAELEQEVETLTARCAEKDRLLEKYQRDLVQEEERLREKYQRRMENHISHELHSMQWQHEYDKHKLRGRFEHEMKGYRKQITALTGSEVQQEQLIEQIKELQRQLHAYQHDVKLNAQHELMKKVERLEQVGESQRQDIKRLQDDIRHAQANGEVARKRNEGLKAENHKLKKALHASQDRLTALEQRSIAAELEGFDRQGVGRKLADVLQMQRFVAPAFLQQTMAHARAVGLSSGLPSIVPHAYVSDPTHPLSPRIGGTSAPSLQIRPGGGRDSISQELGSPLVDAFLLPFASSP